MYCLFIFHFQHMHLNISFHSTLFAKIPQLVKKNKVVKSSFSHNANIANTAIDQGRVCGEAWIDLCPSVLDYSQSAMSESAKLEEKCINGTSVFQVLGNYADLNIFGYSNLVCDGFQGKCYNKAGEEECQPEGSRGWKCKRWLWNISARLGQIDSLASTLWRRAVNLLICFGLHVIKHLIIFMDVPHVQHGLSIQLHLKISISQFSGGPDPMQFRGRCKKCWFASTYLQVCWGSRE